MRESKKWGKPMEVPEAEMAAQGWTRKQEMVDNYFNCKEDDKLPLTSYEKRGLRLVIRTHRLIQTPTDKPIPAIAWKTTRDWKWTLAPTKHPHFVLLREIENGVYKTIATSIYIRKLLAMAPEFKLPEPRTFVPKSLIWWLPDARYGPQTWIRYRINFDARIEGVAGIRLDGKTCSPENPNIKPWFIIKMEIRGARYTPDRIRIATDGDRYYELMDYGEIHAVEVLNTTRAHLTTIHQEVIGMLIAEFQK